VVLPARARAAVHPAAALQARRKADPLEGQRRAAHPVVQNEGLLAEGVQACQ